MITATGDSRRRAAAAVDIGGTKIAAGVVTLRAKLLPEDAEAGVLPLADLRAERGLDAAWLPDPDPEEEAVLAGHWQDGSVRTLRALVEPLVVLVDLG